MKIVSKTGFFLAFVFLLITAYLERGLIDCPYEVYRCTNVIPAMPWYLLFEGVLGPIVLNLLILYLIGVYIDRSKNNSVSKKRLTTIFTFIINFAFSVIFLALGWFGTTYAPIPGSTELLVSQLMILVGLAIMIMSFRIFFTKRFTAHLVLAAVTLTAILLWMTFVSSYDMIWGLLVYVLFMIPLLITQYRSNSN